MSRKHIIIAPHADDEIIGCFDFLRSGLIAQVIFPDVTKEKEAERSAELFEFTSTYFSSQQELRDITKVCKGLVFFPNPVYEFHPDHRLIGGIGERLVKEGADNIVFYSTNMNAPHMKESTYPMKKKEALDHCYPEKASLWQYDHKYFLFEAYTMWDVPNILI